MKTIREMMALLQSIDRSLKVIAGSTDQGLLSSQVGRKQIEKGIRDMERVRRAGGRR